VDRRQVDAFTDTAFAGNPAAVCLLEDSLDDYLRQKIAAELNLSETAFLEFADGEIKDFQTATHVQLTCLAVLR
jgi:PhzF family phenazine biosynthesis protein